MMKKRLVIKLGGSSLDHPQTVSQLAALVSESQKRGFDVVVIHGGGPAINAELVKRGIQWQFINGQRQTTPEMMEVVDLVLSKEVNSKLVHQLRLGNIKATGLSAAEDQILFCSQLNQELMQVGRVESVNTQAIEKLLTEDQVPVVAPVGIGTDGSKYNINADWAAAKIAITLQAEELIYLTDQEGILNKEKKLIPQLNPGQVEALIKDGTISGGMSTKVLAMMDCLLAGIKQVRVLHASAAARALNAQNVGTRLLIADMNLSQGGEIYG